ncbi:MAG: ABC transporter ATP-binding protein [Microbacterium gubbeenense]|uniref:ABC transporter ATP-binding protein n=1 Tax=Microbacteriaceae TaxID=85023 RepID=UPI003F8DF09A
MNNSLEPRARLLDANAVTKSYPAARGQSVPVLRGIDVRVDRGEMVSIVGPSGSGKSTLLYCLAGLETVDAGEISLDGDRVDTASPAQLARMRRDRVGFVFQSYNLIPSLSVRENVALPARLARRRAPDVSGALTAVGLAEHAGKRPGALSGGQQQRVAIARVLAADPPLVFADEPTGALDTMTGQRVLDLLRGYATGDRSVVLVTHDLEAAVRADRTIVLRDGSVVAELAGATAAELLDVLHESATA